MPATPSRGSAATALLMTGDDPAVLDTLAKTFSRFQIAHPAEPFFAGDPAIAPSAIRRYRASHASLRAQEARRAA